MRGAIVFAAALALSGCGEKPAHEYPPDARATFAEGCPVGDPKCDCMWDKITRAMTYEEYEAAMTRFTTQGLMDPKLSNVRLECREAK
jgi:predicted small lipoprotein YifL